jgi:hypothetical protein
MSVVDRFWSKVDTSGECWEWTASVVPSGYGSFRTGRTNTPAHRFSAMLHFGMFDRRVVVCHTCDNRKCVRPDHLVLADHAWNARDRERKSRGADANKTACPAGHDYTPENTYVIPSTGARQCRTCRTDRDRARRASGVRRAADREYQRNRYAALTERGAEA